MKGNIMPLVDALEEATDEELQEAGKKLRLRYVKKFIIGTVVSVAVHFASEAIVLLVDRKRNNEEITE